MRAGERAGRAGALRPGSARLRASPSSVPTVAGGTARRSHCSLSGSPSGRSAGGRAGSAMGGAGARAVRPRGAGG